MKDCPNCQALRDEIEVLKRALGDAIWIPIAFHLTPTAEKVLRLLISRDGTVTDDQFLDVLYTMKLDEPVSDIVGVYVCKLRKVLKPHGISIGTKWGRGYYMMPEDKAKIAALVAAERAVAA